jgi:hypothetical protein
MFVRAHDFARTAEVSPDGRTYRGLEITGTGKQ